MIKIEIFDPTGEDKTEDEHSLTVLLACLIRFSNNSHLLEHQTSDPEKKARLKKNASIAGGLIKEIYPLLGLSFDELVTLITEDNDRWLIDHTG